MIVSVAAPFMPFLVVKPNVVSAAVQVLVALIASGLAVRLLTIRQDRRKIAGEASTNEANAASTLSGAALQMVEVAQRSAREAEMRSSQANDKADSTRRENERLWRELNKARWEIYWLRAQEEALEAALRRADIKIPPPPTPENGFPDYPPPDYPADKPPTAPQADM